ncbi:OPT oligopeptide transporter protein-domain-containing protein [Fusarium flagelliforme]|uniref:OPT oligopeptide transporter protein-domain-containing protein n=1 Tax=Fusarium flagelliforme TaxID=2675880 RepID=UPI001E8D424D|nr:OPT oligopeptide transporter protein-domain-containing protein [Fusarium flagelliforme]KAH7192843.1 OPT oligopeptide transporter protein-domain-containing protein [Fusarium flagelliforme]
MSATTEKGQPTPEVTSPEASASESDLARAQTSSGDSVEEVLSAAGVGFKSDDPTLPCLTLRMWFIGIGFCLVGSGVNTLYTLRFPSISLSQSAIQFLAYPVGKAWEYVLPDWGFTLFGKRHSLNPGPFNHKENMLIYILANLSFLTRLSADVLTEQRVFYGLKAGWGFELLATLQSILFGFALAGLARSLVVEPKGLVWPGVLGNTALNAALHTPKHEVKVGKMSRYRFFLLAFCASFCWYWFPDFIFPALGYFTWICWIAPKNTVVNQVFGMKSGLGLLPFTFDWSQIAYIGSPLVVPVWAILNVLASLVFWIYIISPALYYSNTWFSAHLPLQSNSIYDNTGAVFNVSKVINKKDDFTFDPQKYADYSHIYLPVTYALNTFGLSFATISSLFVWLFLEKRQELMETFRGAIQSFNFRGKGPTRDKLQPQYEAVPQWWYITAALVALGIGIFTYEFYPVQLRWYGVIFAIVVSSVFFVPLAWVYATSNIKIQIDIFCRIIAGYVWEGKVLANIWFFNVGYISGIKGLAFAQDLKLGIYCGIPPKSLFVVQLVGLVMGTLGQVSVLNWALGNIPNVCDPKLAPNGFTCPFSRTHFNTSMVWGALGPRRFFEEGALYRPLLWFFLVGAALPVVVYLLRNKAFPHVSWMKKIHVPLWLGGLNYIPPASGVNYGSWALFGLLFGVVVKKRKADWWRRFNFVFSSALDCSVAIAGIVIFFSIFYTGAAKNFKWWGTDVYKNTCDWEGCTYRSTPEGQTFGP